MPLTTVAAWLFFALVAIAAVVCGVTFRDPAVWPTTEPVLTIVVLAASVAIANRFGTFQTVEGLAEHTSLAMPIGFAMFLLLDWRHFVVAVALGEFFVFVSEAIMRVNPTMWYIRIFNVFVLVITGAGADIVFREVPPSRDVSEHGALDIGVALSFLLAGAAWRALDRAQTFTLISLAAGRPLSAVRVPSRVFAAQFALFLLAIPLARLWYENIWLSACTLAPLAVAYRLLRLPEMEHRLRTDERTGLTNAVAFDRTLEALLDVAREKDESVALLAIDIDHFKTVNDTYGHLAGDAVIARFADVLALLKRGDDVAARTGGEEFAILVSPGDRNAALAFAERIRERIESEAFRYDGDVEINITASIGVAVFPFDANSPRDLRKAADDALYAAKRGGRNAVRTVVRPAAKAG